MNHAVVSGRSGLNIFLVFGVQQVLAVRAIVDSQAGSTDVDNICLLYIDEDAGHSLPNCQVEYCSRSGLLSYAKELLHFKERIRNWSEEYGKVCAFMPHTYYYPANYLFFADLDIECYLIPDGVINYCTYNVGMEKTPSMLLRWLCGLIMGLPYRPYSGHITGIDHGHYAGVYTFNREDLLTTHENLVELEMPRAGQETYKPDTRVCLFLDHYLQDVPSGLQDQIISATRQYLDNCRADTVYYKPHPSWNPKHNAILSCEKCVELDSTEPAELLIEQLQAAEVVSYASSALATISDMYPACQCTSIGLNLLQELPDYIEVQRLFTRRGVQLVDVD